jgi:hypothetical protein
MQPERALRWLDSLDGLAGAARIICAGRAGLRVLGSLVVVLVVLLAWRYAPI